jgi:hypothetical protein
MSSFPGPYIPQPVDILGQYGKVVALRNALQQQAYQQQMQPLQLQQQQNELALQQLQLQDAQTMRTISPQHVTRDDQGNVTGYDWNGLFNDAVQKGVSVPTIQKLQQGMMTYATQQAGLTKDQLANQQTVIQQGFEKLEGVRNAQGPDRQQVYSAAVDWARKNGMDVSQMPHVVPDDQGLTGLETALGMHAQVLADVQKNYATQEVAAKTQQEQMKAQIMQQTGMPMGTDQMSQYILAHLRAGNMQPTPQNIATLQEQYNQQTRIQPGVMRAEIMAGAKEYAVLDPTTGQLRYATPQEINKLNTQGQPLAPAGPGEKALQKSALLEDIRGNIQTVRSALQDPNMPEFSAGQRAQIAIALGGKDPQGALSAALRGGVLGSMNDAQQHYLINLAQLTENAMAMRSVLGAGQGSEDLRAAIRSTIPGPQTPTKKYAGQQLDAFEGVLNRLEKGIPNVPLVQRGAGAGAQAGAGGAGAAGGHVIQIGSKFYQYNGSGDTADLKNYTDVTNAQR